MGQQNHHSANLTSTRACRCTVTMKSYMAVMSFAFLVCQVRAKFPCKPEQIHWNTTVGKRPKCLDCPDCPAGSQPSVHCGTSVNYWPDIHCVPCKRGKTYSDKYDKAQCKACTVCSTGKAIIKNCTLSSNRQCDNKCKQGYYAVPFIFGCFLCSQCCHDGNDEHPAECAHNKNTCAVRSSPCANVRTTNMPTTQLTYRPTTSLQTETTQPTPSPSEMTTSLMEDDGIPTSPTFHSFSVEPSWPGNEQAENAVKETEPAKEDGGNQKIIALAAVAAVLGIACLLGLTIIAVIAYFKPYAHFLRFRRNANSNNEDIDSMALSQLNRVTSVSQEQLNPDDVTLEELENTNMELFDWMCTRLDNGRLMFRRDYERLASKYKRIPPEARNSLRNESLIEGRSPSKLLMSHLQTAYPSLPLRHFVRTLKDIRRNDIAERLTPHMRTSVV